MNDLDQKIRDYYQSQSLAPERVAGICENAKIVRPPFWRQGGWIVAAAAIVMFLGLGAYVLTQTGPSLEQWVAADVAKNHEKMLAPEIQTSDFAEIQAALTRLDFSIAPTRTEMLAGLQVLGGRYCSIGDELAAQISLVDAEGNPCTLYIAPLTDKLGRVQPGIREADGFAVHFWRDEHRLFALAR